MSQGNQFNDKGSRELARRRARKARKIAKFHRYDDVTTGNKSKWRG